MAITYDWNFSTISDYPTSENYVNSAFIINWELKGTNTDGRIATINGNTTSVYKNDEVYIPYDQLTNELLLSWVETQDAMGNLEIHKQQIDSMLKTKK